MSYETQIFAILENLKRDIKTQPLILGSSPTTSGTGGGPPGGIIGHLRQDKVSFDVIEAEDFTIPASGMSLVTNLNRIRYRIAQLEDNPVAVNITVLENGTIISSGVEQINFVNAGVVETVPGSVTVTCSGTGGGGTTTVISGIEYVLNEEPTEDAGTYFTANTFLPDTMALYYNGLRQGLGDFTVTGDNSFTVGFTPKTGDELRVDYGINKILYSGEISSGGGGTSVHNDLTGLQGGTTGEYYHLTQAQYNTIASGIGCRLYRATDQTIGNASVEYVNYSNERWNEGITWSISEPSVIIIDTSGTYIIVVQNQWSNSSSTGIRITAILLNGETYLAYQSNAGSLLYQNVSTIYKFEADDYIQIAVYQTSGGNLNLQKDASGDLFQYSQELSIQKIG
jgi:hypothetical protein